MAIPLIEGERHNQEIINEMYSLHQNIFLRDGKIFFEGTFSN